MLGNIEEARLPSIQSNLQQRSLTKFTIDSILNTNENENYEDEVRNEEEEVEELDVSTMKEDESDTNEKNKDFSSTPSYTAIIAKAILSSSENKLSLGSIYDYIATQFPEFLKKGQGWRNCVRHNLSLSECFIKAGRAKNGRGNYWGIHPRYIQNFLKGDYRKRRASHRPRQRNIAYNLHPYQNYLINRSLYSLGVNNKYLPPPPSYAQNNIKQHSSYSCSCCVDYKHCIKSLPTYQNDLSKTSYHYMPKHKMNFDKPEFAWSNKHLR